MVEQAKLSTVPVGAVEGELIEESQWGAIRALRERGMSKKGISRELGLDIKTVRKWLREDWRPQRRRKRGRELDRWHEFLLHRAPEVGFNAEVFYFKKIDNTRRLVKHSARYRTKPSLL